MIHRDNSAQCCADLVSGSSCLYVALVGMPGIGKTTVANAVLASRRVQHFTQVTITVGQASADAKMQKLTDVWSAQNFCDRKPKAFRSGSFGDACQELAKQFRSRAKPLLLLLDDVWHKQDFIDLDITADLGNDSCTLITTRDRRVLRGLGPIDVCEVGILTPDNARLLFCYHAFCGGHPDNATGDQRVSEMVELSKQLPLTLSVRSSKLIVTMFVCTAPVHAAICRWQCQHLAIHNKQNKKCKSQADVHEHGSKLRTTHVACVLITPMACVSLQVLGSALRGTDVASWDNLISKLRLCPNVVDETECIRQICKPSYDRLPLSLKRCFASFALFPEDARASEAELLHLWSTHEAVPRILKRSHPDSDVQHAQLQLDALLDACLVHEEQVHSQRCFYMHDVLRDLAVRSAASMGMQMLVRSLPVDRFANV